MRIPSVAVMLALALALAVPSPTALAEDGGAWTLARLMQATATRASGTARFVEERHFDYLTEPVRSAGTLSFEAPARFEKHVERPAEERVVIDGDTLTIDAPGRAPTTARVGDYPALAALVTGLRAILTGDRAALEAHYAVDFESDASEWRMALTPRDAAARTAITAFVIRGTGEAVTRVEIADAGGTRTVLRLTVER